jgi:hypothetical protein
MGKINLTLNTEIQNIIDTDALVKQFLSIYYNNTNLNKCNLFNNNCQCVINNLEIIGYQNFVILFLQNNISSITYENINCIYQIITPNLLLIQNNGKCKFNQLIITNFNNNYLVYNFTETFILSLNNNNNIDIINYIFATQ